LADFFYVWLRLALAHKWPHFSPEICPKTEEIVINPTRGQDAEHFAQGLYGVFNSARLKIKTGGFLVFTFHHREGDAWESLLKALCDAGYVIEAVFPVQGEAENAMPIMGGSNITYDLIHVCKVRSSGASRETRSWAGIRQEIRRRAREEIAAIESGRYGNDPLSPSDVNIILIGKCLELYSRHYGAVIDHDGKNVPLHDALKQIRDIADQMTERERPLPSELEEIDPESRVYLRALCAVKEVKSDDVHKATRGIMEPSDLIEAGLMTKMRAGRGRSYEVKQPKDRLVSLMEKFQNGPAIPQVNLFGEIERPKEKKGTLFIDRVHLLLGLVDAGENLLPWLERFRGETPQIRAALEYIESRNKSLAPACRKILNLLEVGPLLKEVK
jgi:adenine-specific DNA methylase